MNAIFIIFVLSVALCTSCCSRSCLTARSEAFDCTDLASAYVQTPDPERKCCFKGQQIIVDWNVPVYEPLTLVFSFVTTHHKLEHVACCLKEHKGSYIYRRFEKEIKCKGAILSYKIELWDKNKLLAVWKQKTWREWIETSS